MKNGLRDQKDRRGIKDSPGAIEFRLAPFHLVSSLLDDNFGFIKSKVNPLRELEINLNFSIILARGGARGEAIALALLLFLHNFLSRTRERGPNEHFETHNLFNILC
jgi:hypothetical protein